MTALTEKQNREQALANLQSQPGEDTLWQCIIAFQQYEFKTYSGLSFSQQLKLGKNGNYTKELFIDRRENSKSLSWSSIRLAFKKVAEIKSSTGEKMPTIGRPKALGDIRGVTYIYAIFFRFGLIEVPDNVKEKMEGNTSSE